MDQILGAVDTAAEVAANDTPGAIAGVRGGIEAITGATAGAAAGTAAGAVGGAAAGARRLVAGEALWARRGGSAPAATNTGALDLVAGIVAISNFQRIDDRRNEVENITTVMKIGTRSTSKGCLRNSTVS